MGKIIKNRADLSSAYACKRPVLKPPFTRSAHILEMIDPVITMKAMKAINLVIIILHLGILSPQNLSTGCSKPCNRLLCGGRAPCGAQAKTMTPIKVKQNGPVVKLLPEHDEGVGQRFVTVCHGLTSLFRWVSSQQSNS